MVSQNVRFWQDEEYLSYNIRCRGEFKSEIPIHKLYPNEPEALRALVTSLEDTIKKHKKCVKEAESILDKLKEGL